MMKWFGKACAFVAVALFAGNAWAAYKDFAGDAMSAASDSLVLKDDKGVQWYPIAATNGTTAKRYGLFVGVNEYKDDPSATLRGCVIDSTGLRRTCVRNGSWELPDTGLLNDGAATLTAVRSEFARLASKAVSGDTVIYFQSSHGGCKYDANNKPTKDAYICLHDGNYTDAQFAEDLLKFADGVRIVVMLDTCHSGGMFKSLSAGASTAAETWNFADRVNALMRKKRLSASSVSAKGSTGPQVGWITAADYNQSSWDGTSGALFTSKLLEGWTTGAADADASKALTFYELFDYAKDVALAKYGTVAQSSNTNLLYEVVAGIPDSEISIGDPLTIQGRALDDVFELEEVDQAVTATGGVPPYQYELVEGFRPFVTSNDTFSATGTATQWYADDECRAVALPFDFRFGDVVTRRVYVDSNGVLYFDGERSAYNASVAAFQSTPGVYALWDDLETYVLRVDSSADAVTICWSGAYLGSGGDVAFSATLYPDNTICLKYGKGNAEGGIVGVSLGSGKESVLLSAGEESFDGHGDVVFNPLQVPSGLKVSESGVFHGRCTEAGDYMLVVRVTDAKLNVAEADFSLTVKEIANKRPVIDACLPLANGAAANEPIIVYSDADAVFQVTARDPEGATLAYEWTFCEDDAISSLVVGSASQVNVADVVAPGQGGVLTCRISDGVWTNEVFATWRIVGARIWHVEAETGSDEDGDGTTAKPFASIQMALDEAGPYDIIEVGDGEYGPISTEKTKITIRSRNGADVTMISGEGDCRAVELPDYDVSQFAELRGFTITGGYVENEDAGGSGARGGKIVNCKIVDNYAYMAPASGASYAKLVNCLIAYNWVDMESDSSWLDGAIVRDCDVVNCTVVDNWVYGEGFDYCSMMYGDGTVAANAIIWNNLFNDERNDSVSLWYMPVNSLLGSDPGFSDPDNGDYTLTADSVCVDAGDLSYVDEDLDLAGTNRVLGAGVNLGAYEGCSLGILTRTVRVTEGEPLSEKLVAASGVEPYAWDLADDGGADGIALSADGLLTWESPSEGEFVVTVSVTDAAHTTRERTLALSVWPNGSVPTEEVVYVEDSAGLHAALQDAETNEFDRLAIVLAPGHYEVTQHDAEYVYPTVVEFYGDVDDPSSVVLTGIPNGLDLALFSDCRFFGLTLERILLFGDELQDCRVTGITSADVGIFGCRLLRCAVYGNAPRQALIEGSVLERCTVAGNRMVGWNTVGSGCTLRDSIIWNNATEDGYVVDVAIGDDTITVENCCVVPGANRLGNHSEDPRLAAPAAGDMRLRVGSPYVGMGIGCWDGDPVTGFAITASAAGGAIVPAGAFVEAGGEASFTAIGTRPFVGFFVNGEMVSSDRTYVWSDIQSDGELVGVFSNLMLRVDCETGDDDTASADPTQVFATIQAAVDAAIDGDTILVAPGAYGPVSSTKPIRLDIVATGGAQETCIDGNGVSSCVRGVSYLYEPSLSLTGFTLVNGSSYYGGGAYYATLWHCILLENTATYGGGASDCVLYNCLVAGNYAENGGGLSWCRAYNCTITENTATYGGGTYYGSLYNSIIWGNSGDYEPEAQGSYEDACCFEDPLFADAMNGDYSLFYDSPCRDAGYDGYATWATDLAGNPRLVGDAVDIGAYENDGVPPPQLSFEAVEMEAFEAQLSVPDMTDAVFTCDELPDWLDLSEDGLLSGTPEEVGTCEFTVRVDDGDGRPVDVLVTIEITENPNRPPEVESMTDNSDAVRAVVGADVEVSVVAVDPEGDELTYAWYLDGELVEDAEGSSFVFEAVEYGVHELVCTVSDGFRTIRAGVWTVAGVDEWFVDGRNGSDNNDGLTPETSFSSIYHALWQAGDYDVISVAPGVYSDSVYSSDSGATHLLIRASGAREETVFNGYVSLYDSNYSSDNYRNGTTLEGFAIRECNSGLYYARFRNCAITGVEGGFANCLFEGCFVYGNVVNGNMGGNRFVRSSIANNVFPYGQNFNASVFKNSIAWGNRSGSTFACRELPGGDPRFVDAANGDLRLRVGTECAGWGAYDGPLVTGLVVSVTLDGVGEASPRTSVVQPGEGVGIVAYGVDRPYLGMTVNGGELVETNVLVLSAISNDVHVVAHFGRMTWYVNAAAGDDNNDGISLETAFATIQRAIASALEGETIHVAPGVYAPITTNNKKIRIVGDAGTRRTVIDANRSGCCAYLGNWYATNTVLVGFTLQNGYERWNSGGGTHGGTLQNCILRDNVVGNLTGDAPYSGGGSFYGTLVNCLIYGNSACYGGGAAYSKLYNCTVVNNRSVYYNGVNGGTLYNTVLYGNVCSNNVDATEAQLYNCRADFNLGGYNCARISDPGFLSPATGNFALCADSVLIDAGDNAYVRSDADLAGKPRICGEAVDVGAYEFDGTVSWSVTFDAGEHGTVNGEATTTVGVADGADVAAPEVTVDFGWRFTGWSQATTNVTADLVVEAQYESLASLDNAAAVEMEPYEGQLSLAGVTATWRSNGAEYRVVNETSTFASDGGTALGLTSDDCYAAYDLPFAFPFYGETYTRVYPNSNGAIFLDTGMNNWSFDASVFKSHPMIAGMWRDMYNGDVYVTASAESVTFRWGKIYNGNGTAANLAITLYADGAIRYAYGSGNSLGGAIGISAGDGENFILRSEASSALDNADDVVFVRSTLPRWLELSEDGTLSGTPTEAGTYEFEVYAEDGDGHVAEVPVHIEVAENPNHRPTVESATDADGLARIVIGTNAVYAVEARDPEGADLTYAWYLDGERIDGADGNAYAFVATEELRGVHTLSCRVSDGLWTVEAGTWTVASVREWFVDGNNGNDNNDGRSADSAFRTINKAVQMASDYDAVLVAPGWYYDSFSSGVPSYLLIRATGKRDETVLTSYFWLRDERFAQDGMRNGTVIEGFSLVGCYCLGFVRFRDCVITGVDERICKCVFERCYLFENRVEVEYYGCEYYQSTIVRNVLPDAHSFDASVFEGSIVWDNSDGYGYACTDLPGGDPRFVDAANGDLRLRVGTECAGWGAYDGPLVTGLVVSVTLDGVGEASPRTSVVQPGEGVGIVAYGVDRPYLGMTVDGGELMPTNVLFLASVSNDVHVVAHFGRMTWYVDAEAGDDNNDGISPETAFASIQTAVDLAYDGETIHVAAGTYEPIWSQNKRIRIVGDAGARKTIIDGGGMQPCASLGDWYATNTVLCGFTLQNGNAQGGSGGGSFGGTLENCILRDNRAYHGGGAYAGVLINCLIVGNAASYYGGGSSDSKLYNCTVVCNSSRDYNGVSYGSLYNTVLWGNVCTNYPYSANANACNCAADFDLGYASCLLVSDPGFQNPAFGNFALTADSPLINAGDSAYVRSETDLAGKDRIQENIVDIGAYEGVLVVAPPADVGGVTASDATQAGTIRIGWNPVADADAYRVYRSGSEDPSTASLIGETDECFWIDTTAVPLTSYFYWVSAVGFGGASDIASQNAVHDGGMALSPLVVTSTLLPTGTLQAAYSATLTAAGGEAPYVWSSSGRDYSLVRAASTWTGAAGTPTDLSGDDVCKAYDLPFAFPFYGTNYSRVWISSNGTLSFGSEYSYQVPSLDAFGQHAMIAVLWKDLIQGSGAVYVDAGSTAVTFVWLDNNYYNNSSQKVNAAVTLSDDGTVRMSFGEGNANGGWIGLSAGDGTRCEYENLVGMSLAHAQDFVFSPNGMPPGLVLDTATGVISGVPTDLGDFMTELTVRDIHGNAASTNVCISIVENPRVVSVTPSAATVAEGETVVVKPQLGQILATGAYAFLVPQDAVSSNAVACSAFTRGVFIRAGAQAGMPFALKALDGSSATAHLNYKVVLRTAKDWDAGAAVADYLDSVLTLTVTNTAPVIAWPEANETAQAAWLDTPVITGWRVTDVPADATNGLGVAFAVDSAVVASFVNQTVGAVTNFFNSFGDHTLTMIVTDKDGGRTVRTWNYNVDRDAYRQVTFNAGGHGRVDGGSTTVRYALPGGTVTPPSVRADNTWVFTGWDADFSNVSDDMTVTAVYRSAYPDLHVDAVAVPESGRAGAKVAFGWTIGNTGYPAFNGRMTERVSLVNAANTNDVRVVTNLVFSGTVERDATVVRTCDFTLPLKGLEGDWLVRVETAISPSVREAGGENFRIAETILHVEAAPLPDIAVSEVVGPTALRPGDTVSVTYVTANVGTTNAVSGWTEQLYLESIGGGTVRRTRLVTTNAVGLAVGESRTNVVTAIIPEMVALSGNVRFRVLVDEEDEVVEINDLAYVWHVGIGVTYDELSNNTATSGVAALSKRLYLTARSSTVAEDNASGVRFTVKRSGETDAACELALSPIDCEDLILPSVTIPAGRASTTFTVKPVDNDKVDGDRAYDIAVAAEDYEGASEPLLIDDDEVPSLTLTLDKSTIREGDGVITATVRRELVTDEPLTVYLSGASTARCTYPSSVVIEAGQDSVTFEITPVNNDTAQIAANLTLRASAGGYTSGSVSYTVEDDDVPGVTLTLTPEEVQEGGQVYATLTRCDESQINKAITVKLTSSLEGQVDMRSSVTIPAYTMAVRFGITAIDNGLDDGTRTNRITGAILIESCGCSGQPSSGDVIEADLVIYDNDGPALSISANPATMKEGLDEAGWLTISHNSSLDEDLELTLWHNGEGEIEIAETVVIPAGQTSVRVPVKTLDDGEEDGGKLVSVYVDDPAGTFASAATWIQVSDQNLPDLKVDSVVLEFASYLAQDTARVVCRIKNVGYATCPKSAVCTLYRYPANSNFITEGATLVGKQTITSGLKAGSLQEVVFDVVLDVVPGDFRFAAVIDEERTLTELDPLNNAGTSGPIAVGASYYAETTIAEKVFTAAAPVNIVGQATRQDGTPARGVEVEVYIVGSGVRRKVMATSDDTGRFEAVFAPSDGEAGHFAVGACYPGTGSRAEQCSFDIIGMQVSGSRTIELNMTEGDTRHVRVTLRNMSPVALTGLSATVGNVPAACSLEYSIPEQINGNGYVTMDFDVSAIGVMEQVDYAKIPVTVSALEGASCNFALFFHSQSKQGRLVARPSSVDTTLTVGTTRQIEIEIVNDGAGETGPVRVELPIGCSWLRLVEGTEFDSIPSSGSITMTLVATPPENLTLNNRLSGGSIAVNCSNGSGCSIPVAFTPVSDATGSLTVDVIDNNTYAIESSPHLKDATITVKNPYTGEIVRTGTSGSDGMCTFAELPVGLWWVVVSAPNHDTFSDTVNVEPARETTVTAFVQYTIVKIGWDVVPTTIEDSYEINLVLEYETQVPAPIVELTIEDDVIPDLGEGQSHTFLLHYENKGFIAAENVSVVLPEIEGYISSIAKNDFTLAAGSAIDVPVTYSRSAASKKAKGASSGGTATSLGTYIVKTGINWACGEEPAGYQIAKAIYHLVKNTIHTREEIREIQEVVVRPVTPGTPDPTRRTGGTTLVTPTGMSDHPVLASIGKFICDNKACITTILGCTADLILEFSNIQPAKWASCGRGLMECADGMANGCIHAESTGARRWYDCGMTLFDCGWSIVGCFKDFTWGKWVTVAQCVRDGVVNCIIDPLTRKKNKVSSKSSVKAEGASDSSDSSLALSGKLNDPAFAEAAMMFLDQVDAMQNWWLEFFGDRVWLDADKDELSAFLLKCREICAQNRAFSVDELIDVLPTTLSRTDLERFVDRWVRTMSNEEEGVVDAAAGEAGIVRFSYLKSCGDSLKEIRQYVKEQYGYDSLEEMVVAEFTRVNNKYANQSSVCSTVKLSFSQTLCMTREAFDGTLTVDNGSLSADINDLKMTLRVEDAEGTVCNHLFEITANGADGMSGGNSIIDGGLSVTKGGCGRAYVRFVPSRKAAEIEPKVYWFGGTLTYTDPTSGLPATYEVEPIPLTVHPSPYLQLYYFVQRDVYADDPFTSDVVEASLPAELAVLIRNVGEGAANNVTISSVQPEIVENAKGAKIDFALKDYTVEKTALNGATGNLSLNTVTVGDIPAHGSAVAQWWLTSTLEGHFVGMTGTVTPVNSWNAPDMALVDSKITVLPLVKSIRADDDELPDFLVCSDDMEGTPSEIYFATGGVEPVNVNTVLSADGELVGGEIEVTLNFATASSGWSYGCCVVPGVSRYVIESIVRDDGSVVDLNSGWITDRTFRDGLEPLLEDRLHLVDDFAASGERSYTVTLVAKPTDVPEVSAFEDITDGEVETAVRDAVTVIFSKAIDATTFTADDLALNHQGAFVDDLAGVTIEAVDETATRFVIRGLADHCGGIGRYELTVQCAGIADLSGNLGTSGKAVSWTYSAVAVPYIVAAEGVPTKAVRSLDAITVTTSMAVTPASFASANIWLNETDVSSALTITATGEDQVQFTISGLDALQTADGSYELTINGTDLRALDGTAGVNTFTCSWVRDTTAPVLESVVRENGLEGMTFKSTFSEAIDSSTLSLANVRLMRNGQDVALPPAAALAQDVCGAYVLSGVDGVLATDGAYELSFDATGVSDEAGNVASGSQSVVWTVDTTPPTPPTGLAVSSEYGSIAETVYTAEGALMLSGVSPEAGVTVKILYKYFGGSEVLLATPTVGAGGAFSADLSLPEGGGNFSLIVRLADAAGNVVDKEIKVYYDKIALTAELSGAPEEAVVAESVALAFSDVVVADDVTLDKFALTLDGEDVPLDGVTLTADADGKTFVLSGLSALCSADGNYALTFDSADVRKRSSGLKASACETLTWSYECPDREPPTVVSVSIDGADARGVYTNGISSVSVTFSEDVNLSTLVADGLVGQALTIQRLDANGAVTGVVRAAASDVRCSATEIVWTLPEGAVGRGYARFVADAGLIADLAGNKLATTGFTAADGLRSFSFGSDSVARVAGYAMPTWYDYDGDGLGDLIVGEKTAGGQGKVRVYRNVGTATEPAFGIGSYLKVNGEDLVITASGCQGAQACFADVTGDGYADLIIGYSDGKVQLWPGMATAGAYGSVEELRSGSEATYGSARACAYPYDLDGDGATELIVGGMDGKFRVLKYAPGGSTESWLTDADGSPLKVSAGRSSPVLADINGDGCVDILSGDTDGNVWAFFGEGATWNATPVALYKKAGSVADRSRLGFGDVNGDGVGDLLVGRTDGSVAVAFGARTDSPSTAFCVKGTYTVTFDLGEFGILASGALVQHVVEDDAAIVPTVEALAGWRFTGWLPDAGQPIVANTTYLAQYERIHHTVAIGGGMEITDPAAGSHDYAYGSMATVTVLNAVCYAGPTQYVCMGWSAVNAEPDGGSGTQAVFKVLGDVDLSWLWQTNVLSLAEALNAPDREIEVGGASSWTPAWSAEAPDGEHYVRIGGIANRTNAWMQTTVEGPGEIAFSWKCSLASRNTKMQFFVDDVAQGAIGEQTDWTDVRVTVFGDGKHVVRWRLFTGRSGASAEDFAAIDGLVWKPTVPSSEPPTLAEALNTNLVWRTDGAVAWRGVARESLRDVRDAWASASGLANFETAAVWTKVYGSGVLSFDWAISCEEEYDWMELTVDGNVCTYITGEVDWSTAAVEIKGEGWHDIRWEYVKDEEDEEDLVGDNAAWLDNVVWTSSDVAEEPDVPEEPVTDPIPDLGDAPTAVQVQNALAGSGDSRLAANVTNGVIYNAYRNWANKVELPSGGKAGQQAVKDSPNAWVSFALGSETLLEKPPTDEDLTIEEFEPAAEAGKYDFTVSVKDVAVGSTAAAENLKKVFGLEGGSTLQGLSSDNVDIVFGTPENGKVKFTAGPNAVHADATTFFMKVKFAP